MDRTDRAGLVVFCVAIAFLAFLAGAYVTLAKLFPYGYLNDAYKAAQALRAQHAVEDPYTQTDLWRPARRDDRGVTVFDSAKAFSGYTLYTSGDGTYAQLIDMQGRVAHRWSLPFSRLWKTTPDGRAPRSDDLMYWRKARVLPNGDLVAVYIAANDTPWGYGLVKLDRDSRVLWSYRAAVHHDLDIAPDGRVIALTQALSNERFESFAQLETPWMADDLVVLSGEDGHELNRVPLFQSFLKSAYRDMLYSTPIFAVADPLHTNSVQYLDETLSRAFVPAKGREGQVLLSFRHPGTVALVDPRSGEMTWATRGPWIGQHYARALPNGNFTLFDNLGNYQPGNRTRILEVNPRDNAVVWQYTGDGNHPFDSGLRGAAETLPNGNRLITESDGGRLFEVSPDGEIVWEFVNPVRGGDKDQFIPVVSSGQRIASDAFDADFRAELTNGGHS